jgi:hypothetical protein
MSIAPVGAAGYVPPTNPRANLSPLPRYTFVSGTTRRYVEGQKLPACWRWGSKAAFVPQPNASACLDAEVEATNRAHRTEGAAVLVLPRNFSQLTVSEQLLVLVDSERVSRGEAPVAGLSKTANAYAQRGAVTKSDPVLPPSSSGVTGVTGTWASNYASAISTLDANYEWMYVDGWQGASTSNDDCTSSTASGCWGHRDNILANDSLMPCNETQCSMVMGAGFVANGAGRGYSSYSELLIQVAGAVPPLYYTWNDALAAGAKA